MRLPQFDFMQPKDTAEACRVLRSAGGEAEAIAGGTELVLALKNRQKKPRIVVDLSKISHLDDLSYSPATGLHIGAMATLRHLAAYGAVRKHYPMLAQAALSAGSLQLQAMATVAGNLCQDTCCQYYNRSATARRSLEPCHKLGGNVCHVVPGSNECWASYAGDMAPALMALEAKVAIANGNGGRLIPVRELFSGDGARPRALRPGEIVTEIEVPPPQPGSRQAYCKLRQRGTLDYALLGTAVHLTMADGGRVCEHAKVALTALDRAPIEVPEAARLDGTEVSGEAVAELAEAARGRARPMKNIGELPASYRRDVVIPWVESSLKQALEALEAD